MGLRCRRIRPDDLAPLAALLAEGFPAKTAAGWRDALARILAWTEAGHLPGPGFVLAQGEALVGCLLTLYAARGSRCSTSSWYVKPAFSRFGAMLVNVALHDRTVTCLNVSSERHTRPIIEAQGFRRYTAGVMLGLPLLARRSVARARVVSCPTEGLAVNPAEAELVANHAALGCLTFWCVADGRAFPFVIVRRVVAGRLPVAQIVYCAPETDWAKVSHAVGCVLARHGLFALLLDAAERVPGLPGRFLPGRMPKYVRGPDTPAYGVAYTEIAVIGT